MIFKKATLAFVLFFSFFISFSMNDDTINNSDSEPIETVISDTASKVEMIVEEEKAIENAEKNAQYFMYGFLVLGAFLLVWKWKNNK